MKAAQSFSFAAFFAAMVLFLPACGGGGGEGSESGTSGQAGARYGSLTLNGTGTNVAGTTFNAVSRIGPSTLSQWYNVDISGGLTYPSVVLVLATDSAGTISVDFNHLISSTQASGEWLNPAAPTSAVAVTPTSVTFTNLELQGYGGTNTTLIINGTLTF